jgi:hypothetical protein
VGKPQIVYSKYGEVMEDNSLKLNPRRESEFK